MVALVRNNPLAMNFTDTQHSSFQQSLMSSTVDAQFDLWKLELVVKLKPSKHCTPDLYSVFICDNLSG